jgi:hypothetical protein
MGGIKNSIDLEFKSLILHHMFFSLGIFSWSMIAIR